MGQSSCRPFEVYAAFPRLESKVHEPSESPEKGSCLAQARVVGEQEYLLRLYLGQHSPKLPRAGWQGPHCQLCTRHQFVAAHTPDAGRAIAFGPDLHILLFGQLLQEAQGVSCCAVIMYLNGRRCLDASHHRFELSRLQPFDLDVGYTLIVAGPGSHRQIEAPPRQLLAHTLPPKDRLGTVQGILHNYAPVLTGSPNGGLSKHPQVTDGQR